MFAKFWSYRVDKGMGERLEVSMQQRIKYIKLTFHSYCHATMCYTHSNQPYTPLGLYNGRTQNAEPYSMEYPMEYLKWSTPKSHVLVK